jgi:hypothetical protein
MKEISNLVIGTGQIGTAIYLVLRREYEPNKFDIKEPNKEIEGRKYQYLHICFPPSAIFSEEVKNYQQNFLDDKGLTIIHSTTPIGTSRKLNAVHSPCRGKHPDLYQSIFTFVKYFGGERAEEASNIFKKCGVRCVTTPNSDNTEALKLWDTTQYAWNVILEKQIYEFCRKHNLDFDLIYREANRTYNEGYEEMNLPQYKKYILEHQNGKIGGHCLIPNCKLLDSKIAKQILKENEKFK